MKKQFIQFAPDSSRPNAPGTYGWGFDSNGFRVVMYGPKEEDTDITKDITRRLLEKGEHTQDLVGNLTKAEKRSKKKFAKFESKFNRREEEHGPAHVHVIDKKSARESKFELIEDADGLHQCRLLETNGNGNHKKSLTKDEIIAAKRVIDEYAENFIQLWREFYCDKRLANYVTRTSEKYPKTIERIVFDNSDNKKVNLTTQGSIVTQISFDDYVHVQKYRSR